MTDRIEKSQTKPENETSFVGKLFDRAKRLPDTVPIEIRNSLSNLSAEINGKVDGIKGKAEPMLTELKERAREVSQKYILEGKTAILKGKKGLEKVLQHAKSFDDIRAGDILRMRSMGENIADFLLTDEEGDEVNINTSAIESFKGKKLLVNFGSNRSINASIGLGDILPYEVKKVEVIDKSGRSVVGTLGSQDSRKGRRERIGYYDENGKYIAVYSGYSFKILETGAVNESDKARFETLQKSHLQDIRVKEMIEVCISKNGYKKVTADEARVLLQNDFSDSSDTPLFAIVAEKLSTRVLRGEHMREAYKDGIGSRDKFVGKFGWYLRDVIAKDFPGVPAHMLVNLFQQESKFDPNARNASTGAYGLGQIIPDTWSFIEERTNKSYDKESPYDQIHASAAYLNWIMGNKGCDIVDAMIYYHMGHNVDVLMQRNDQVWLTKYKVANPAVVKNMVEDSWQGYWNAARKYYTEDPSLLKTLDLSKTGTVLATRLGDFVMSTSLPNTGSSSCGRAVGILLNTFGFEDLPQSDRNGKNWTKFLDARPQQFKKVPIRHPDEATPGAILVYDGSGNLGSEKNKEFGHVEIKGSDLKYYHYLESDRPGGSAANNAKSPEEYRKLSGFTGFAYYPLQKQA